MKDAMVETSRRRPLPSDLPGGRMSPSGLRRVVRGEVVTQDRARRMRWIATGLLVLMAVVFVLSGRYLDAHPAWGFVHAFSEAAMGGAIALIRNGDTIRIDAAAASISVDLSGAELYARRKDWTPPDASKLAGALQKYAVPVVPANLGAVTHAGNLQWEQEARIGVDTE